MVRPWLPTAEPPAEAVPDGDGANGVRPHARRAAHPLHEDATRPVRPTARPWTTAYPVAPPALADGYRAAGNPYAEERPPAFHPWLPTAEPPVEAVGHGDGANGVRPHARRAAHPLRGDVTRPARPTVRPWTTAYPAAPPALADGYRAAGNPYAEEPPPVLHPRLPTAEPRPWRLRAEPPVQAVGHGGGAGGARLRVRRVVHPL